MIAPADHPHRDAVCATLAWLAEDEGSQFECYFEGQAAGTHYGGGHPGTARPEELRGGTFTGGRHLEQLYLLLQRFDCEAACLGETIFDGALSEAQVPVRARSSEVASFYVQVFAGSSAPQPETVLVVGDGGRPQGVGLGPYAFPEIVNRRLLAIAAGDSAALATLRAGRQVEHLWDDGEEGGADVRIESPADPLIGVQTGWMAARWAAGARGFLLGDPELVGRWTPSAVRERWLPIFGVPQSRLIHDMRAELAQHQVVFGRQQDDRDFVELSRVGVAFQLIDPGRPPFPALKAARCEPIPLPAASTMQAVDPSDAQLDRWAAEGRVLATLLFWSGMIRELENMYALADVFSLTGISAGVVVSSDSFEHMPRPPLTLAYVPRELGGLAPRIELLLGSGGIGAFIESEAPIERFAKALGTGVERLSAMIGPDRMPRGWWGTMDAPMQLRSRNPRLTREPEAPFVRIRYGRTQSLAGEPPEARPGAQVSRPRGAGLRRIVRSSPISPLFQPLRPFDAYKPGPAGLKVLEAVRDAGFEYAFTKAGFGGPPAVVRDVRGLTAINYTAGRWDGWTPFETVNSLADLAQAERKLLRSGRPGWLTGTLDTCLWAFSGPFWERAHRLRGMCEWMAGGGASGRLVNATPRTVARFAARLAERGEVGVIPAG